MAKEIINPVLRGFNPDPSMIRVGDDYYIATSTFEWFPGVQIHHSKDLVNWRLLSRPLTRRSQLDLLGVPDSCGVWAPCLSFDKGLFYLVYSNVKSFDGVWKDTPNYLVTAANIEGPWSEPVFLNSSGFDASLFHDNDGRKYLVNMIVDHRKGKFFGGIVLQEYDPGKNCLTGEIHHIFDGTEIGITEAPHLYKKNGFYYLFTAEGGTEYNHAVTVARSRKITGPYEVHPKNPIITSKDNPDNALQKAGHASIVETQNGSWYAAFLVGRPLAKRGRCTLGRESAIARVEWKDDAWIYLSSEGNEPATIVPGPELPEHLWEQEKVRTDFDTGLLDRNFQSLRIPINESWCTLKKRPGFLRLYGRESLSSYHFQSLIAKRIQDFDVLAATCLEFDPVNFQQMAGLVCYYNTSHYHYLHIYFNQYDGKRYLQIITCDKWNTTESLEKPMEIAFAGEVFLKSVIRREKLQFFFASKEGDWNKIGPVLDASILSDDYIADEKGRYRPAFTGMFVGLCCQDLSGQGAFADFKWFDYMEEIDGEVDP